MPTTIPANPLLINNSLTFYFFLNLVKSELNVIIHITTTRPEAERALLRYLVKKREKKLWVGIRHSFFMYLDLYSNSYNFDYAKSCNRYLYLKYSLGIHLKAFYQYKSSLQEASILTLKWRAADKALERRAPLELSKLCSPSNSRGTMQGYIMEPPEISWARSWAVGHIWKENQ